MEYLNTILEDGIIGSMLRNSVYMLTFFALLTLFTSLLRIYLRYRSRKNFEPFEYNGKKYQLSPNNLIPIPEEDEMVSHLDMPLNKSLEQFFYLTYIYNLPHAAGNLVAAYILRWIYRGNIKQEYRLSDAKDNMDITLKIVKKPKSITQEESFLWDIIEASKVKNNIISAEKMESIVDKNRKSISLWIPKVARTGSIAFFKNGYLEEDPQSKGSTIAMRLNEKGKQAIRDFFHFRAYLDNFTLLEERSMPEVALWDDYLILATALGLGDKVASQMKRIIPTFSFLQNYFVIQGKNRRFEIEYTKPTFITNNDKEIN